MAYRGFKTSRVVKHRVRRRWFNHRRRYR
uniref:Uncharacterized protein ORF9 n=1 Tax=Spiroplasma virus 4 TaxID=2928746 RepID=ORF9_SPV4|nr:RecName: Full=Uncharacterized protein ORF9 [Spiroplasma phage 4]